MPDKPRTEIRANIELCVSSEHLDQAKLKEWLDWQINIMLSTMELCESGRVDFVRWE
jgi:hypothetical protein